ncbi:MAG: MoaD/ThiS family protein [Rubripirellula sp.]
MANFEFSAQLARHVECPVEVTVDAESLQDALLSLFEIHPLLRDYVLEADGVLRKHITLFVDGEMVAADGQLDIPLSGRSEVFVMQAVAGG